MLIVRSVEEATIDEPMELERSTSTGSLASSIMATQLERSQSATFPILERSKSMVNLRPKADIPTPIVETVQDYEITVAASFQLPKSYIRAKKIMPSVMVGDEPEGVEYNLEHDDLEWLSNHRVFGTKGDLAGCLDADKLERILDELEKVTGTGEVVSQHAAEEILERRLNLQPLGADLKVVQEVYQYWILKRQRMKKPLLRKFWPVTSINDTNPHLVFRPREKERYKLRKHRKNDMDSFRKMQTLRRDFDRLKDMLELVKRRERLKLIAAQLEEQQFLQTIAELTGQQRKPVIPKEGPAREDLKLKIRVRPSPTVTEERQRKRRQREDTDAASDLPPRRTAQEPASDLDRLKHSVGNGLKEKEQALATPDYLPSFMEELKLRLAGRAPPLRPVPYSDDWAYYGWRTGRSKTRGGSGRIGHMRSGVCSTPRCPPIEYTPGDSIRFRCRPRVGRGGRLLIDRIPMSDVDDNALKEALWWSKSATQGQADAMDVDAPHPQQSAPQQQAAAGPGWSPGSEQQTDGEDGDEVGVPHVLMSGSGDLRYLDQYPTLDLLTQDLFKYPVKHLEIAEAEDNEDELLEPAEDASSQAEAFVLMPNKPAPLETDALVVSKFTLRL